MTGRKVEGEEEGARGAAIALIPLFICTALGTSAALHWDSTRWTPFDNLQLQFPCTVSHPSSKMEGEACSSSGIFRQVWRVIYVACLLRGGRTRSNGKCSKKVAMMDKDLNGNWSNGKCPNWK